MPITINGSTGISGVDGSAGTPALIGSNADTGLVFGAGQVSASLNGTTANVPLVQGTAQVPTSGTAIDFTGIPIWAKRITVALGGVSLSGTANLLVQIGTSGGIEITSYASSSAYGGSSVDGGAAASTSGFVVRAGAAAAVVGGVMTIANVSGNAWATGFAGARIDGGVASSIAGGGTKTLGGTLDRVRITSTNGTDTFDAGSINIFYE